MYLKVTECAFVVEKMKVDGAKVCQIVVENVSRHSKMISVMSLCPAASRGLGGKCSCPSPCHFGGMGSRMTDGAHEAWRYICNYMFVQYIVCGATWGEITSATLRRAVLRGLSICMRSQRWRKCGESLGSWTIGGAHKAWVAVLNL